MVGLSTAVFTRRGYTLFAILFCCLALYGQELHSYFHHLSTENSKLTQGQNCFVFKDSRGFIWISSVNGLNRYDSREVKPYRHIAGDSTSLRDNLVNTHFFEDKKGDIWFTTATGINCYIREKDHFTSFAIDNKDKAGDYYAFHLDKRDRLWVSVQEQLYQVDIHTRKATLIDSISGFRIAILTDQSGEVTQLISSFYQTGIFIYDYLNGKLKKRIHLPEFYTFYTLPEQDTLLWVATSEGLVALNPVSNTHQIYRQWQGQSISAYDVEAYGEQQLLVSTGSHGVLVFDKIKRAFIRQFAVQPDRVGSLRRNQVNELYLDRDQVLWASLLPNGLDFVSLKKTRFPLALHSVNPNYPDNVLSLAEDRLGQVWATTTYGVYVFDQQKKQRAFLDYRQLLPNDTISEGYVAVTSSGDIQLSTTQEILQLNPVNLKAKSLSQKTDFIIKESYPLLTKNGAETILTYYGNGILEVTSDFKITESRALAVFKNDFVSKIFEDRTANLLFFSLNGTSLVVMQQNSLESIDTFENVGQVIDVVADISRKFYWVASSEGLAKLDIKNKTFRFLTETEGVPPGGGYNILINPKNQEVWLSSNRGLLVYNPATKSVRRYNQTDGLQSNEFTRGVSLKDASGHFWFGGVKGLNVFDPDKIQTLRDIPGCELLQLLVNDQPFDWQSTPLRYSQNTVSFQFRVLDFANPNMPHRLRYKLEGYDQTFLEATDDQIIRYAKLPPSRYTLQVDVANADGIWFENRYELPIRIKPPFWMRWWFILPAVLLLLFLGWRTYQYDLKRRLQNIENQRLRELDTFKTTFFTNITHEFRTPLTLILGPVSNALKNGKVLYEKDLQLVRKYSQRLLAMINQILDLNKLDAGKMQVQYVQNDIVAYIRYLVESFESWAVQKEIKLAFESEADSLWMDFDPEKLAQIVSNLLSNAIKYTEVGGHINVMVKNTDQALELSVADTGIGIQEAALSSVFDRFHQIPTTKRAQQGTGIGLALTKELVTLLSGRISVESVLGKGSTFKVQLPITHKAPMADFETTSLEPPHYLYESAALPPLKSPSPLDIRQLPQVLIIEDNMDVANYIAQCLQPAYELSFAFNGIEGVEKTLELLPDLIISDVMMPGKDGFAVCDALKNNPLTERIPIILLTAKVDAPSQLEGFKKGADAYLTKPFDEEELTIQITHLLRLRQRLQQYYLRQAGIDEASSLYPIFAQKEPPLVSQIRTWVEKKLDEKVDITIDALCKEVGLNQSQLNRQLNHLIDMPPKRFIQLLKLKKAKYLLRHSDLLISEIAYESGFEDPTHFNRTFRQEEGFTPKEYREKTTKG